jgi:uncharacterized protein YndB with AHSA1/START domain
MLAAEADIEIAAPIDKVWRVMLATERYGEWNPFIVRVEGAATMGGRLRLHVRWHSGGGARSDEIVTQLDPPADGRATLAYRFTGLLASIGAVGATRVQSLRSDGTGTRYQTREEFRGWLSWALPLAKVQAGFDAHAKALKARAESDPS